MTTTHLRAPENGPDVAISENVATLLHRARWSIAELAREIGMTRQTLNRKVHNGTSWYYSEVAAVAEVMAVTVEEMATGLPSVSEWKARWDDLRACRDSNPKPSDLYPPRLATVLPFRLRQAGELVTAESGRSQAV